MDRKSLQELENKCIQEEPPACVTSCPIHVDARTFIAKVAGGKWDDAVETLSTVMPLPRILARICDHPCEEKCLRSKAGDPIAIGDLEKAAIRRGKSRKKPVVLPARNQRVALVGGGLSGLTAASDLIRKGYGVTVISYEDRLGGVLRALPAGILPAEVVEEEMATLERMGLEARLSEPVNQAGWIEAVHAEFDAVYVALDESGPQPLSLPPSADPTTLCTTTDGLFVGRKRLGKEAYSPIEAVAEGRKAATSIDRYLQKVSLTAGREREAVYTTRLHTSLEGVLPAARETMKESDAGYDDAEAVREASRCIQCECMECVKACLYLERFKSYPKRYVRQIGNDETIVMGSHGQTIKLVNSCSLCGLCKLVCPNDLSMAKICMEGRESLVKRGKMAPSAHDFALTDMASSNSEKAALASHEPGKSASAYAFFPGCQMGATRPDHVIAAYDYLRGRLKGGTGLILRCCGAPAEWAARKDLLNKATERLKGEWERLGKPILVTACPTCSQTLKRRIPEMEFVTLWQVLADSEDIDWPKPQPDRVKIAVHDPCTTRNELEVHASIRSLLTRAGYGIDELTLNRDMTECCGFGGLMSSANPTLAKDVARRRASESEIDYVTYCAMCRNALAASGKRTSHVLDLLFSASDADPASRKAVGFSERSENRYRLKQKLLTSLWGKKEEGMEADIGIELYISDTVATVMEERRILREDVQRVIHHAEATGNRLCSPATGRYRASFRPASVTYWVEYSTEGEGFRVHAAYYHRMEVVSESGS
jgi:glutamate synthase (NADPH) small chain